MEVSKKKLVGGSAWIPLGLALLGNQIFAQPVLTELPFGGAIASVIYFGLSLSFAFSISYAIILALYKVGIGVRIEKYAERYGETETDTPD